MEQQIPRTTSSIDLAKLKRASITMSASTALARAFPKTLKEIRLHLCQTGQASAGTRYV